VRLLTTHVVKEETGLYPLLRAAGTLDSSTSDELEAEHRELDARVDGGTFDRRADYALAAHIEHEEMELFPDAMFGFEDDAWDALDAAHRRAEAQAASTMTVAVIPAERSSAIEQ
jgi:hemerythrin-like domain-containing protein